MLRGGGDEGWPTLWHTPKVRTTRFIGGVLPTAEPWMDRGACVGRAPAWDRQIAGESEAERVARQAESARVCRTECEVLAQCRAWARSAKSVGHFGVCAGMVSRGDPDGGPSWSSRQQWVEVGQGEGGRSLGKAS